MGRTLVFGDIHGSLRALTQLMERCDATKNDQLIFLGDYVDGWSQSPEVVDFLIGLKGTHHCIFIRGNHDDLLMQWLQTGQYSEEWFNHGGRITMERYNAMAADKKQLHLLFLESLKDYHLDDSNRLYVHAGFTNVNGVGSEYFTRMFYWDRTLWETALALDTALKTDDVLYPKRFTHYKEVFIGHTPVTRIGQTVPVQKANIWNVDTGAAFKGPLTAMDADTKHYWQSEPVYELYPEESGRN